jgi:hypothetical protein
VKLIFHASWSLSFINTEGLHQIRIDTESSLAHGIQGNSGAISVQAYAGQPSTISIEA